MDPVPLWSLNHHTHAHSHFQLLLQNMFGRKLLSFLALSAVAIQTCFAAEEFEGIYRISHSATEDITPSADGTYVEVQPSTSSQAQVWKVAFNTTTDGTEGYSIQNTVSNSYLFFDPEKTTPTLAQTPYFWSLVRTDNSGDITIQENGDLNPNILARTPGTAAIFYANLSAGPESVWILRDQAPPPTNPDTYHPIQHSSGKYLTITSKDVDSVVDILPSGNDLNRFWMAVRDTHMPGYYWIRNNASGHYLVPNSNFDTAILGNVEYLWNITRDNSGIVTIQDSDNQFYLLQENGNITAKLRPDSVDSGDNFWSMTL